MWRVLWLLNFLCNFLASKFASMSLFDLDEIILENNIQVKEFELLRLIEEGSSLTLGRNAFHNMASGDRRCVCNLQVPPNPPAATQWLPSQIHLNKMRLNIRNGNEFTKAIHNNTIPIYCPHPVYNLHVSEKIRGQVNPDTAFNSGYAAKTLPTSLKKFKNNRKKNFSSKWSSHISIDYTKVVVNLQEIGLGCRRSKPMDKSQLILQFRRTYIYLTSLCKERMLLESIVFSKEHTPNATYVQPVNISIARHFEYTLNILSNEVKYVESIFSTIQLRCEDADFAKLYRKTANDLVSAVNMFTLFFGPDILYDVTNADVFRSVDDALKSVITAVRSIGALYTILAQKLLIKETSALQCRRKMFIGR